MTVTTTTAGGRRVALRLDEQTYELLAKVAAARGVAPTTLAHEYVEFCLTSDAYEAQRGTLEQMVFAATRDASERQAAAVRSIVAKGVIASATATFLNLEVLAQYCDFSPAEAQRFYDSCRGKAVAFARETIGSTGGEEDAGEVAFSAT
ncbi:MAG TPA: hypothetical protein ENN10_00655 [Actinobacteria bacterium]|nr:hypothetical protein [Actinomycetota bacterium]